MATIRELARESGVSIGAVSRILNGDPSLSVAEETRQHVWDVAKKMDYQPVHRKGTRKSQRKTLGIIMTVSPQQETNDPYFMIIREGVERQAEKMGFIITRLFRGIESVMAAALEEEPQGFDCLVIIGHLASAEIEAFFPRVKYVVFVDHRPQTRKYDSVSSELGHATRNLIDYFCRLNYKKIGFIGGTDCAMPLNGDGSEEPQPKPEARHTAFCRYMKELGIFEERYVYQFEAWTSKTGYESMKDIMKKGDLPEAFIVANDMMAIGALGALREGGIGIPEDIALASFNDMTAAAYMHPSLTSVHIYAKEMGEQAIKMLLDQMDGRKYPVSQILPTKLMIRATTGGQSDSRYEDYVI